MMNNQRAGDDSSNLQAGGDITVNNNVTFVVNSVEEVSKQLLDSVFGELSESTKRRIRLNQESYFQVLAEKLQTVALEGQRLRKIIDSPDFQYISKNAGISASRSSSV